MLNSLVLVNRRPVLIDGAVLVRFLIPDNILITSSELEMGRCVHCDEIESSTCMYILCVYSDIFQRSPKAVEFRARIRRVSPVNPNGLESSQGAVLVVL